MDDGWKDGWMNGQMDGTVRVGSPVYMNWPLIGPPPP